jgi:hypothetical protein
MMNTKYRKWELLGIFLVICLDKREKSEILAGGVRRGIAPMPKSVRLPRFLNSDSRVFVIKITYLSCSIHLPFILTLGVVSESFFPAFRDIPRFGRQISDLPLLPDSRLFTLREYAISGMWI